MILTVENFQKTYRNQVVLRVDALKINAGIHWFEGINGSGKSTFFKAVAGIIPFEGAMHLHNVPNNKANTVAYRRLVNYAYAEPKYPDYLSGAEIINFVRTTRNGSKVETDDLIAAFSIWDYFETPIQTYSSGMLRKISLLSAFIGNPKLILLDEPFTTIDTQTSTLLYTLIQQRAANGISFFIASHQKLDESQVVIQGHYKVQNGTIRC